MPGGLRSAGRTGDPLRPIRDPNELLPHVRELLFAWLKRVEEAGFEAVVVETFRTMERQQYLYEYGRSKVLLSWHNLRRAWDAYPRIDGRLCFIYDGVGRDAFNAMGEAAHALGIEWGGDWKTLKDFGHFQVTDGMSIREAAELEKEIGEH